MRPQTATPRCHHGRRRRPRGAAGDTTACTPVPGAAGCYLFPDNNVWHADISKLPVNAHSAAWMASTGADGGLRIHPDFGGPYGIPYTIVNGTHPKVPVAFDYADESDRVPYPLGSDTKIEDGSDAHALVLDNSTCKLYETWDTSTNGRTLDGPAAAPSTT